MNKKIPAKKKRSDDAKIIAEKFGFTAAYVRMVIKGDRENEAVKTAYKNYQKQKTALLKSIKNPVKQTA